MPFACRGAQALHTPGRIITYARSNHYIRQVESLHTPGRIITYARSNHYIRQVESLHTPGRIITYARSNHYIRQVESLHTPGRIITRQGVWATHGPNAPKRRYLGTISAKLLMYLDENLPSERLRAPHLHAIRAQRSTSITYARSNHYIRQGVWQPTGQMLPRGGT